MRTKVRTQIQLEPEDLDHLKSFARRKGISVSNAVGLLVRESLAEPTRASDWSRLMQFAGYVSDDPPDVARNHDRYLYGPATGLIHSYLSRVSHHHPYELPPLSVELRTALEQVESVLERLEE